MKTAVATQIRIGVAVSAGLLILGFVLLAFVPLKQDRIFMNHYRAIRSMQELLNGQRKYAAAHPQIGYACDFDSLRGNESEVFIDALLARGKKAGYVFELRDCRLDSKGKISHFVAIAAPVDRVHGQWVFCEDERSELWFSKDGSKENCIARKNEWRQEKDHYK
jgi:hypothetical protein